MSLTKQTKVDQISISENGTVFYRELTEILEDDKVISKSYHRKSLVPGTQLDSNTPSDVANVCNVIWTDLVVTNFQNSIIDRSNVNS
jgi:hypothetical protein